MKQTLALTLLLLSVATVNGCSDIVITAAFDGPLTGGIPKGVELYVPAAIADMSIYGIGSANNGGGTDGEEFTFPAVAVAAGTYLYVASESPQFTSFFGFAPDYTDSAVNVNGDDAIELFKNGAAIDVLGDINTDGSGQAWEYTDGWAYRKSDSNPTTTFSASDWTFSGTNQLEGGSTNAATTNPVPIGTYTCSSSSASNAPSAAPAPVTIEDIQGNTGTSPLEGDTVDVVDAVVTSINYNGFFIQQPDVDPTKSSGIFVFTSSAPSGVSPGDVIDITGTVGEYYSETQLSSATWTVTGTTTIPDPIELELPAASQDAIEPYEGMLVSITTPDTHSLVVSEYFNMDRYGTFVACSAEVDMGRIFQYSQVNTPDATGYAAALELIARSCVTVDDNSGTQNPDPVLIGGVYPVSTASTIRGGSNVTTLVGGLRYAYSLWTLNPQAEEDLVFEDPLYGRDTAMAQVSDLVNDPNQLRVVSTNLLNFFTSIDTCGSGGSFRGADDEEEYLRQEEKMITAMSLLSADIYGAVEIENTVTNAASWQFAKKLSAATSREYTSVTLEAGVDKVGDDAIKVDIFYDKDKVTLLGVATLTDADVNPTILAAASETGAIFDGYSRVPLAATFAVNDYVVTVVVNHFKSKGSSGASGIEADASDGAGAWNNLRTQSAAALMDWLSTYPTGVVTDNILLMGDFNAYASEPPVTTITGTGYVDLESADAGTTAIHSYAFDGQWGTLDYMFSSPDFAGNLLDIFTWHVNSDELDALDYNLDYGRDETMFDGSVPYRFSDHDPIVATFSIVSTPAPSAAPTKSAKAPTTTASPGATTKAPKAPTTTKVPKVRRV
eukprot:Nitzschia sp. Nitz4//NODE_202_length_38933_cov_72.610268//4956//7561//NITZ4_additional_000018-RA//1//CDS//3329531774//1218//frame0